MNNNLYGWGDLDEANKEDGHYNKRPRYLNNALRNLYEIQQREIKIINQWEDGDVDYEDVLKIQTEREEAEKNYLRLYERWNGK